jgi:DNA-binding response OmpR family regulator
MIRMLLAVRPEQKTRYDEHFQEHTRDFSWRFAHSTDAALDSLSDRNRHTDVLVLDNGLERAYDFIQQLRKSYPRLIIVLVDEDVDFATPGQADDISTEPFQNDDLVHRVQRLMSDRQLETIRADAMPPVREFARLLRKASGETGKHQAALDVVTSLGFDYAAFYKLTAEEPVALTLTAQHGMPAVQAIAPKAAGADDLIGWVAMTGHSRTAGPDDRPNHPLVERGRLGAIACAPVGTTIRYGVLVACKDIPNTISQQNVLLLELIGAQLAATLSKE